MPEVRSDPTEGQEKTPRNPAPASANRQLSAAGISLAVRWAILLALAFVWLVMLVAHADSLDRALFSQIYGHGGRTLLRVAYMVTRLGTPGFLYVVLLIAALALVLRRRTHAAVLLIVVCLICRILVTLQKGAFALPRPDPPLHHVIVQSYAFPSGHSANSMATYLALALLMAASGLLRRAAITVALAMTFAVGVSRIILGVHWPSDVIGGWAFGCFWTVGGLWLADVFKGKARISRRVWL